MEVSTFEYLNYFKIHFNLFFLISKLEFIQISIKENVISNFIIINMEVFHGSI